MKQGIFVLISILIVFLLPACAAEDTSAPGATFSPIAPLVTKTKTRQPTPTIFRTSTIPPTQTPTPEPVTPTPSQFSTPATGYNPIPESLSPSGRWLVWQIDCADPQQDACLQFSDRDSRQKWFITEDDLEIRVNLPYTFRIEVAHWPGDWRYVYLATSPKNFEMSFSPINAIIKFSLINGTYSYILDPTYLGEGAAEAPLLYRCGFSNNDQWLAYAVSNGDSIDFTIFDLITEEEQFFSVAVQAGSAFGDIHWSPEDDFFVFSVSEDSLGLEKSNDFSIFLVGLEDLSVTRISPHGSTFLFSPEWISDTEVKYQSQAGEVMLNIETGEVTEVENE